jgi:hypothetical protein
VKKKGKEKNEGGNKLPKMAKNPVLAQRAKALRNFQNLMPFAKALSEFVYGQNYFHNQKFGCQWGGKIDGGITRAAQRQCLMTVLLSKNGVNKPHIAWE